MLQDPELLMMTNYYKQMCMCEACQSSTYMQSALDTFRRNHLSQLERDYKNYSALSSHEKYAKSILLAHITMYKIEAFNGNGDQHMYPTPRSTEAATQCPSPYGSEYTGLTRISCASSSCKDCGDNCRPAAENRCKKLIRWYVFKQLPTCLRCGALDQVCSECIHCSKLADESKGPINTRKHLTVEQQPFDRFWIEYEAAMTKFRMHRFK